MTRTITRWMFALAAMIAAGGFALPRLLPAHHFELRDDGSLFDPQTGDEYTVVAAHTSFADLGKTDPLLAAMRRDESTTGSTSLKDPKRELVDGSTNGIDEPTHPAYILHVNLVRGTVQHVPLPQKP